MALVATVGCGGKNKKDDTLAGPGGIGSSEVAALRVPRVDPSLCDTKGKKVTTFDLNRDNKPDVWKLFATMDEGDTTVEVLTCKQVDFDHDGTKDYVATYKNTGEMIAEEFDFTFDGKFDAREHYDNETGKVYLIERDSDHDKKPDVWEKYDKDGRIESIRRDRNADGKPDVWEQYKAGELLAILYDDDYDNKVDRREDNIALRKQEMEKQKKLQESAPKTDDGPVDEPETMPDDEPSDDEGAASDDSSG
jgi:hypothetical protein